MPFYSCTKILSIPLLKAAIHSKLSCSVLFFSEPKDTCIVSMCLDFINCDSEKEPTLTQIVAIGHYGF